MAPLKYEEVVAGETKPKKKKKQKSRYPISIGKEILEPETELTFTVSDDDVIGSVVADKEGCAAAKALCKMADIEHAWVFRSRTLIRRTDGVIERYANPRTLKKAVEGFDSSAGFFPAGEYQLQPLRASSRKDAKRRWNDKNKDRHGGTRPYEYVTSPKPLRNR